MHCRDGFEALGALVPPPEKRGLALIDPPYEETDADFARVADALAAAAVRWPQGVLMAWYPIKQGEVAARLHRKLLAAGVKRLLAAELCVHPDDSRAGLNGSGIVTINPPWRFEQDLHQLLPRAARRARRSAARDAPASPGSRANESRGLARPSPRRRRLSARPRRGRATPCPTTAMLPFGAGITTPS